jgi:hypothetical protein
MLQTKRFQLHDGPKQGLLANLETLPADLDLAVVVAAWHDLPPALRAGILAMVKGARKAPEG